MIPIQLNFQALGEEIGKLPEIFGGGVSGFSGGSQLHKIENFGDQKLHFFGAEGAEKVEFLAPQAKFLKICFLKIE